MNPEQWARLKRRFGDAMDAPSAQLEFILARAEAEEPELAGSLRALLAEHARGELHTQSVLAVLPRSRDAHPPEGPPGGVVGPYRLLRELGRGGSGIVYLAERGDDEFHRQVALKILRYATGGPDSPAALTLERRGLARLQHAHIALLLDWGATPSGEAWLATEYVEGVSIDRYCREHVLDLPSTLAVFRQVCEAVEYAHRRLLVHRDLKPANILVTAAGEAKLVDFGIAAGLDEPAPESAAARFTPLYASPEQLAGGAVTAASDVYSLGVVLYELLAATVPLHRAGAETLEPSAAPGLGPARRRALRGDLDHIVLHALEPDPDRRYPSVEQLLADLDRYRTGFAPAAARPGRLRRGRMFLRRHRLAVGLAALAAVALGTSTAVAVANARAARAAQRSAERRFADVQSLSHWVIFDAHDAIRLLPGTAALRRELLANAVDYLDRLSAERSGDDALSKDIAQAYLRVGYDQGGVMGVNLGNTAASMRNYRAALSILDGLWARHPDDAAVGAARFAAAYNLALMLPDPAQGTALAARYAREADAWAARAPRSVSLQAQALVHSAWGRTLRAQGDLAGAMRELDHTAAIQSRARMLAVPDGTPLPMFDTQLSRSQNDYDHGLTEFGRSEILLQMGQAKAALAAEESARQLFARSRSEGPGGPSDQRMRARIEGLRAETLLAQPGPVPLRAAAAASHAELGLAIANAADGSATAVRDLAEAHRHRADVLAAGGNHATAARELQPGIAAMENLVATDPVLALNRLLLAGMLNDAGWDWAAAGQSAAAPSLYRRALEWARQGVAEAPSSADMVREQTRAERGLSALAAPGLPMPPPPAGPQSHPHSPARSPSHR